VRRELRRVARARAARDAADAEYRDAIGAARAAGLTLDAIGAAAGITKQGVRKVIGRT
jgi:hypothetical protein